MNRDELVQTCCKERGWHRELPEGETCEGCQEAAHVLYVAHPLIEADLREQLAQEIEAKMYPAEYPDYDGGFVSGLEDAAEIVRGNPPTTEQRGRLADKSQGVASASEPPMGSSALTAPSTTDTDNGSDG